MNYTVQSVDKLSEELEKKMNQDLMEKSIEQQSNLSKNLETISLSRPKVSIYIASSIDGYIARKDGNLDWLHYGHAGDEDYGFKKFTSTIDAAVMGRNTYEVVAGFDEWAYTDELTEPVSPSFSEDIKEYLPLQGFFVIAHVIGISKDFLNFL